MKTRFAELPQGAQFTWARKTYVKNGPQHGQVLATRDCYLFRPGDLVDVVAAGDQVQIPDPEPVTVTAADPQQAWWDAVQSRDDLYDND